MTNPDRPTTSGRRIGRALAAALLAFGLAMGAPSGAQAIPPDGAGPDTPGTRSRVWPKKVKAGDRLNFEVSGYPANETVYIKIDDGLMCSNTSHGACVYHTQKLNRKGYAKGSIVVPSLAPGKHWLRMLATGDVVDSKTGEKIGYEGYTRRGGNDFTVLAGGSSTNGAGGSGTVAGGGSTKSDGTIAGGSVAIELGDDEASPTPEASAAGTMDDVTTDVAEENPDSSAAQNVSANGTAQQSIDSGAPATAELPVVGIAALAGAVVIGGVAVGLALARRNRLLKEAVAAESSDTGE